MLKVREISKIYPNSKAGILSCCFELKKGKCLAIVGESGSGKTTLLQILAGFLPADTGEMYLRDSLLPLPTQMLVRGYPDIQLVPQDFKLLPNHYVWENILYPIRHYPKPQQEKKLAYLADLLGLQDFLERFPRELSGGQQQRTAVARALAGEPDVLLLDEPFNQADSKNKQHLLQALATLKKKDKTGIVLVTHEVQEALALADEMMVLQAGKVVQKSTPEQIYQQPATRYIAEMCGYVNYFIDNKMAIRAHYTFFSPIPTAWKGKIVHKFYNGYFYRYVLKVNKKMLWEVYHTASLDMGEYFLDFQAQHIMAF